MEINITLFIQAIHFFVALYILRILYFKPALAVLDIKSNEDEQQLQTIRKWQVQITQKESDRRSIWQKLKKVSAKQAPEVIKPDFFIFKGIAPSFEPEPLDAKQVDSLVKTAKGMIIKGAEYVDV